MDKIAYCSSSESEEEQKEAKAPETQSKAVPTLPPLPSISAEVLAQIPTGYNSERNPIKQTSKKEEDYRFTEPAPLIIPTIGQKRNPEAKLENTELKRTKLELPKPVLTEA